jgi:hypothetical protein
MDVLNENSMGDYCGGRFGLDFYAAGRISAWESDANKGTYVTPIWNNLGEDYGDCRANIVPWGHSDWELLTMDFVVPALIPSDGGSIAYSQGQLVAPTGCIPWVQAATWGAYMASAQHASAWFADPKLYIIT